MCVCVCVYIYHFVHILVYYWKWQIVKCRTGMHKQLVLCSLDNPANTRRKDFKNICHFTLLCLPCFSIVFSINKRLEKKTFYLFQLKIE